MKYENRIVLFLDILGFKKIVLDTLEKNRETNEIVDNSINIRNLYETLSEMGKIAGVNGDYENITVTQFSDSIVISFLDESHSNAPKVFEII